MHTTQICCNTITQAWLLLASHRTCKSSDAYSPGSLCTR